MRTTAKQYREQLYRLRAHPRRDEFSGFMDRRDSFATVYFSVVPFLALEYWAEVTDGVPGGLIFPVGFLLFWAFYYTYYKPGFLENRLTAAPAQFNLTAIPTMILGVLIWFVKVTFVELSHLVVFQWMVKRPAPKAPPRPSAQTQAQSSAAGAKPAPPPLLAPDLIAALQDLGLKPGCTWKDIHRQYRALAKQLHPDLNPDITDFGHRFMRVDAAYHRLEKARTKHFAE